MPFSGRHDFRDDRTGQWRRARTFEKNQHFVVDTLSKGLASFCFKTMDAIADYANEFADELVDYAKEHAPWEDRSGEARAGLNTAVLVDNGELSIDLYHTVSYGIWLEIRWGAKFAIIIPTIEQMGPKLFEKMNGMIGDIIYYG